MKDEIDINALNLLFVLSPYPSSFLEVFDGQ